MYLMQRPNVLSLFHPWRADNEVEKGYLADLESSNRLPWHIQLNDIWQCYDRDRSRNMADLEYENGVFLKSEFGANSRDMGLVEL